MANASRQPRKFESAKTQGISRERLAYLAAIKDKINRGYYNTEPVIDDLSHSFTKAVDALI
jgi:hypothetical protein